MSPPRLAAALLAFILAMVVAVLQFGDLQLEALPRFVTIQITAIILLDAITALLLFGQFHSRRLPLYLGLGAAYLLSALLSALFLFTFPGAVLDKGGVVGGLQSAPWVWFSWHFLFALVLAATLMVHIRAPDRPVSAERARHATAGAIAAVGLATALVAWAATLGHAWLPVLIIPGGQPPITPAFLGVGSVTALMTAVPLVLALIAYRRGNSGMILVWLALALTAGLADVIGSVGATTRYSLSWYMARAQSLIAAGILLGVFLAEMMRMYHKLGEINAQLTRQSASLTESNADLSAFAHSASHDLKAPLRTVTSYAQLLMRHRGSSADDAEREYLGHIISGTKRMNALVTDLLAFARIDHQGNRAEMVDTGAVISAVLADLGAAIDAAQAVVTVDAPMPVIRADAGQLAHLFQNLIGNALKYRDAERVPEIHIGAVRQDQFWEFTVVDNGIGIAETDRHRVFNAFERLHTNAEYEGSGIGLAIVRRIVDRHGGRIWVDGAVGRGSTFHVILPA